MPQTEHTYFLGLLDYEWTAVSAIATAAAAVIALFLPFGLDFLTRRRANRQAREHVTEALDATFLAIIMLGEGVECFLAWDLKEYTIRAAWALPLSKRLNQHALVAGLPHVAVDCVISAAAALQLMVDAEKSGRNDGYWKSSELDIGLTIALHARTRADYLAGKLKMQSRPAGAARDTLNRISSAWSKHMATLD